MFDVLEELDSHLSNQGLVALDALISAEVTAVARKRSGKSSDQRQCYLPGICLVTVLVPVLLSLLQACRCSLQTDLVIRMELSNLTDLLFKYL